MLNTPPLNVLPNLEYQHFSDHPGGHARFRTLIRIEQYTPTLTYILAEKKKGSLLMRIAGITGMGFSLDFRRYLDSLISSKVIVFQNLKSPFNEL